MTGILLLSLVFILHGQDTIKINMMDFIQIKIRIGYTIFGTRSISLQREGLIYWTMEAPISPKGKIEEEAKFIPYTELDKYKIFEIMNYVHEQKLYEIKKLEIPEECVRPEGNPDVIDFIILSTNTYCGFSYWVCDERVDKLIKMMNELIPQEDRKKFEIRSRCY